MHGRAAVVRRTESTTCYDLFPLLLAVAYAELSPPEFSPFALGARYCFEAGTASRSSVGTPRIGAISPYAEGLTQDAEFDGTTYAGPPSVELNLHRRRA
jgi:hypothetical protein